MRIQPRKPGSITLSLKGCGKDCSGCPHPRFDKWHQGKKNSDGSGDSHFNERYVKRPLAALRPIYEHKECFEEVKKLISEAQVIIKKRKMVLGKLSELSKLKLDEFEAGFE